MLYSTKKTYVGLLTIRRLAKFINQGQRKCYSGIWAETSFGGVKSS